MALNPGNEQCTSGLAKELHDFWVKPKEEGGMEANDKEIIPIIDPATGEQIGEQEQETTVKRFCYNLAKLIIDHIVNNMEIVGVEVSISDVSTTVNTTTTCPAGTGTGVGTGSGSATGQQSNSGTGLVR
jgi:hypothetical protein